MSGFGKPFGAPGAICHLLSIALLTSTSLYAQSSPPSAPAPAPVLETVLVTGEQPGPGLWKVSKGDHVLWILGTLRPLPKDMTWRSRAVETAIAQSQEVIGKSQAMITMNVFASLVALPSLLSMKKVPDGKQLRDVLPAELYARWTVLKEKYIGRDNAVESLRPRYAAEELYRKALQRSRLTADQDDDADADDIWNAVKKTARKKHTPIVTNDFDDRLENPRDRIREMHDAPIEPEIACLATRLDRLESDLQNMRLRANAWAVGDIDSLRKLPHVDQKAVCLTADLSVPGMQAPIERMDARLVSDWMKTAEAALDKNASTFGLLSIEELFGSNGRLALLRAKGYVVDEPQ